MEHPQMDYPLAVLKSIKVVQTVPLEVNLCVWVLLDGYPWWPARILDWKDLDSVLDSDQEVAPKNGHNTLVEWFDPDKNISVLDNDLICEYTTNMHLAKHPGPLYDQVLDSCRAANNFMETNKLALKKQVRRYKKLESFEEFIKPKQLKTKARAGGRSDAGKASKTGKSKNSGKNKAVPANPAEEYPPEIPVPRKRTSKDSGDPQKPAPKREKGRFADLPVDTDDSHMEALEDSEKHHDEPASKALEKSKHDMSRKKAESDNSEDSGMRHGAQSTSRDEDADRVGSPSAQPSENRGTDDHQYMSDNSEKRKRRQSTSSDSAKDGATKKVQSKKRRLHNDVNGISSGASGEDSDDERSNGETQERTFRDEEELPYFSDSDGGHSPHRREREDFENGDHEGYEDRDREEYNDRSPSPRDDASSYSSSRSARSRSSGGNYPSPESYSSRGSHYSRKRRSSSSDGSDSESYYEVGAIDGKLADGALEVRGADRDIFGILDEPKMGPMDKNTHEFSETFTKFQVALMNYNDVVLQTEYLRHLFEKSLASSAQKRKNVVSLVQELRSVKATPQLLNDTKIHEKMKVYVRGLRKHAPVLVKDLFTLADEWSAVDGVKSAIDTDAIHPDIDDDDDEETNGIPNGISQKDDITMKDVNMVDVDENQLTENEKADRPNSSNIRSLESENVKMTEEENGPEEKAVKDKEKPAEVNEPEKMRETEEKMETDNMQEDEEKNKIEEEREVGTKAKAGQKEKNAEKDADKDEIVQKNNDNNGTEKAKGESETKSNKMKEVESEANFENAKKVENEATCNKTKEVESEATCDKPKEAERKAKRGEAKEVGNEAKSDEGKEGKTGAKLDKAKKDKSEGRSDKAKKVDAENAETAQVGETTENENSERKKSEVPPTSEIVPNSTETLQEIQKGGAAASRPTSSSQRAKNLDPAQAIKALAMLLRRAGRKDEKEVDEMAQIMEKEVAGRANSDKDIYYKILTDLIKKLKKPTEKALINKLFETRSAAHFFD